MEELTAEQAPTVTHRPGPTDVLLVAVPLVAAVLAVAATWRFPVQVGDAAWLTQRVADAAAGRWPLVGMPSTIGGGELATHHPGPVEFYWLAPFWRALGFRGIAIGSAASGAVALTWLGWTVRRLPGAGVLSAVGAQVAVAIGLFTIGPETLADPWNPYVALPWAMLLLAATTRIWSDDPGGWPAAAVAATVATQLHAGYLPAIAVLAVVLGLRLALRPSSRPHGALLWGSVGASALLWIPPAVDLVAGEHNPVLLVRSLGGASAEPAGSGPVLVAAAHALSPVHRTLDDAWVPTDVTGGELLVVLGVLVFGIASWSVARRGSWPRPWIATFGLSAVVWMLLASRAPLAQGLLAHSYVRPLWPIGAALWFGMGAAWWTRRPAWFPRAAWLAPAAVMALWAVTVPRGYVGIDPAARARGLEVVEALEDTASPATGLTVAAHGPVGGTWLAPAITAELDRRGVPNGVGTDELWDAPEMTTRPSPLRGSTCVWSVGDLEPDGEVLVPRRVSTTRELERLDALRAVLAERYPDATPSRVARLRAEADPAARASLPTASTKELLATGEFADLVLGGLLQGISLRDDDVADYVELTRLGSIAFTATSVVAEDCTNGS